MKRHLTRVLEGMLNRLSADPALIYELVIAFETFVFGLWLLHPAETFAQSRTFVYMSHWAPEWVWGFVFASVGTIQIVSILIYYRAAVNAFSLLASMMWIITVSSFYFSNPQSTAIPTYILAAVGNIVLAISYRR